MKLRVPMGVAFLLAAGLAGAFWLARRDWPTFVHAAEGVAPVLAVRADLEAPAQKLSPVASSPAAAASGENEGVPAVAACETALPAGAVAAPTVSVAACDGFVIWMERWTFANPATRDALLAEGVALATARRAELREWIRRDPQAALAAAVPYAARKELPVAVVALLEEPVSGAAAYTVTIACGGHHGGGHADHILREVQMGERQWLAFTYAERLATTSKQGLSLHGMAVDDVLAMHADPVRQLSAAEAADRGLGATGIHVELAGHVRTLADEAELEAWREALLWDERRLGPAAGPAFRAAQLGQPLPATPAAPTEDGRAAAGAESPNLSDPSDPTDLSDPSDPAGDIGTLSTWTEGGKTMLYIRARFSDEATDFVPIALSTAQGYQNTVSNHWQQSSYGKSWIVSTYTDVVALPTNAAYYKAANLTTLLSHASTAAKAANAAWDIANFNLHVVVTSNKAGFDYAGIARVGAAGAHLRSDYASLRTAGHEYGHNLGLWHANYWRTDSTAPIGRDSVPGGYVGDVTDAEWLEYGHRFSLMSAQSGGDFDDALKPHFSVVEKHRVDWLTTGGGVTSLTTTPATGVVIRLYRQDHRDATGVRGLKIDIPTSDYTTTSDGSKRRYWLSYRRAFNSGTPASYAPYGVQVDWSRPSYGLDGAIQLDMTPFTRDVATGSSWTTDNSDKEDGMQPIGRTYSDPRGIHFTPVAYGDDDGVAGNGNEWIAVDVRIGSFIGNQAPAVTLGASTATPAINGSVTFTATATDPDGDALSYWWDFGDNSVVLSSFNNSTATKSWSSAGVRVVRVVVSDRKGGQTTAILPVTVGTPANIYEIRGRVLRSGAPVVDARVYIGTSAQAWTDSQGRYILAGLSTGSHTVLCRKDALTFTAQFANPVSTSAGSQYGKDFFANEVLADGGGLTYSIAGNAGVAGAEIAAGGITVVADANGAYSISGLTDGTYTVTPQFPDWVFSPATRSVTLAGVPVTGQNFTRQFHTVSGTFSGIPNDAQAAVVTSSGGASTTATIPTTGQPAQRVWSYSLSVPAGLANLRATLAGYVIEPNFSNPLSVGSALSGRSFTATAGTVAGAIGGRVTTSGRGLTGAAIEVSGPATAVGTTDSDGYFSIPNLVAGAYTVTASRAGYAMSVPRTGVAPPETRCDFTATPVGGPVISAVTASPATVPGADGSTDLSATVLGGTAPLVYHWTAVAAPGPVRFSENDSASAASTTAGFTLGGAHTFRVRVVDANGLSGEGTVAVGVQGGGGRMAVTPYDVLVPIGQSVAFVAQAWDSAGNPMATTPAWSVDGGGSIDPTSGVFTAATLGNYLVGATDGVLAAEGMVQVVAAVGPAAVTGQPVGLSINEGQNAAFSVTATGSGPLTYQWRRDGVNLADGGRLAGVATATLTITGALPVDAGEYTCHVSNSGGNDTSSPAVLAVNARPTVKIVSPVGNVALPDLTDHLVLRALAADAESTPVLAWSQQSGPAGQVAVFASSDATNTSVRFPAAGTYVLRATASDGALSATADVTVYAGVEGGLGASGLRAEYWGNMNLSGAPAVTRVDDEVNFDWGNGAPGTGLPTDGFSARWTGVVVPAHTETYTFFTRTDDGARLYLDGSLVIDKWVNQSPTEWSATRACVAGVPVEVRMEYYENTGGAVAQLRWSSAGTAKAIIPNDRLHVEGIGNAAPRVAPGAGGDAAIGVAYALGGSVTDDGRPEGSALQSLWSRRSGPGGAVFGDPATPATTVLFDTAGTHVLRLHAEDGAAAVFDERVVMVVDRYADWIAGFPILVGDEALPNADPDRDGMTNEEERIAGTDPADVRSFLRVAAMARQAVDGRWVVSWPSASNRWYAVFAATNVAQDLFPPVATNLPATPPQNVHTDATHAAESRVFFRVGVRDAPP